MNSKSRPVDTLDRRIRAVSYRAGRASKAELGAAVGLSATRCAERMKRLQRDGVIRGEATDIDLARLGAAGAPG